MAKRTSPEITPGRYRTVSWNYGDSSTTTVEGTSLSDYARRINFAGAVTPGFRTMSKRQKKSLAPVAYTYSSEQNFGGLAQSVEMRHRETEPYLWTGSYSFSEGAFSSFSQPSPTHIGEAYDKALSQLVSNCSGVKVNVAEVFAERHQLVNLVTTSAIRLATAARALKRGRLGDFNEALKSTYSGNSRAWLRVQKSHPSVRLSNHWLEFKYGWLPLVQDLHGASELLADHINSGSEVVRSTGNSSKSETKNVTTNTPVGVTNTYNSFTKTSTKIMVRYIVSSQGRQILSQTGITNPALLAWELLPYSFVVDWFIPVGQYIEALNGFDGLEFQSGCITQFTTLEYAENTSGTYEAGWQGGYFSRYTLNRHFTRKVIQFDRNVLSGFPAPSFPSFKANPLGGEPLNRVVTALSLLATVFGRTKP